MIYAPCERSLTETSTFFFQSVRATPVSLFKLPISAHKLFNRDVLLGTIEAQERDIDDLKKSIYELSYMLSMQVFIRFRRAPPTCVPLTNYIST